MEPTVLTAIVGGIVTVIGSLIAYMTAKRQANKDITITDRQQLSQEQQELRKEMREEVKYWRDRYDGLEKKVDELITTNVRLQGDVDRWKEKYEVLAKENERISQENAQLTRRVSELEGQLRNRRNTDRQ